MFYSILRTGGGVVYCKCSVYCGGGQFSTFYVVVGAESEFPIIEIKMFYVKEEIYE